LKRCCSKLLENAVELTRDRSRTVLKSSKEEKPK
jgi:hypothetical protein